MRGKKCYFGPTVRSDVKIFLVSLFELKKTVDNLLWKIYFVLVPQDENLKIWKDFLLIRRFFMIKIRKKYPG